MAAAQYFRGRGLPALLLALAVAHSRAVRLSSQHTAAHAVEKPRKNKIKPFVMPAYNGSLYFMHLPKAAGDSFLSDAPKYTGKSLPGAETNFCKARTGRDGTLDRGVVAMMRDPRAHVLSMYFHCKTGLEYVTQGWSDWMPDRIIEWLGPWSKAGDGNESKDILHRFCCYNPVNLQSRRFSCSQGLTEAKKHLSEAFFVGLVEYYHVSMCLYGAKVNGTIAKGCNCDDKDEAQKKDEAHASHGVQLHSWKHLPAAHLRLIDEMTQEDAAIYELARQKFVAQVEKAERQFRVRLVCDEERKALTTHHGAAVMNLVRSPARPPAPGAVVAQPPAGAEAPADHAPGASSASAAPAEPAPPAAPVAGRVRSPARPPARASLLPPGDAHAQLSLLSVRSEAFQGSSSAGAPPRRRDAFCPNEGYLLHGTGAGK